MMHEEFLPQSNFFVPFPQTSFLANLISVSLFGFESFGSFHLVSKFLVVSYSLTGRCECWLSFVKLSLHYENVDNVYIYIIYIYIYIYKRT